MDETLSGDYVKRDPPCATIHLVRPARPQRKLGDAPIADGAHARPQRGESGIRGAQVCGR